MSKINACEQMCVCVDVHISPEAAFLSAELWQVLMTGDTLYMFYVH